MSGLLTGSIPVTRRVSTEDPLRLRVREFRVKQQSNNGSGLLIHVSTIWLLERISLSGLRLRR